LLDSIALKTSGRQIAAEQLRFSRSRFLRVGWNRLVSPPSSEWRDVSSAAGWLSARRTAAA